MAKGVRFTKPDARRIAKSVRHTEANATEVYGSRAVRGQILFQRYHLWGQLDGTLSAGGTQTVSVWETDWSADTGENIENVVPPPTMTTGSITSGSWVRICRRPDGVWYVDLVPC